MSHNELEREITKRNTYIRELKTLVEDLLYYNNVVQCRKCKAYKKKESYCTHWNREVLDYGYCNFGVRK